MNHQTEVKKCRAEEAVAIIRGKWRPSIMYELQHGPVRFRALQRSVVGIRHKVLTSELKQLMMLGVVQRTVLQEAPVLQVTYGLTPFGEEVRRLLAEIGSWSAEHLSGSSASNVRAP